MKLLHFYKCLFDKKFTILLPHSEQGEQVSSLKGSEQHFTWPPSIWHFSSRQQVFSGSGHVDPSTVQTSPDPSTSKISKDIIRAYLKCIANIIVSKTR